MAATATEQHEFVGPMAHEARPRTICECGLRFDADVHLPTTTQPADKVDAQELIMTWQDANSPSAADKATPQWQWKGNELWTAHSSNGLSMDRLVLFAEFVCVPGVADGYKESILSALNQAAAVVALTEAAQANLAWHVAEELSIGSFQARMELCNYAQWLTRKALGDLSDYEGVPRLLLDTQTFSVDIARCDVEGCKALVREALDLAAVEQLRKGEA